MIGVSASTLRNWEEQYGFPQGHRDARSHRRYSHAEILAVVQGLREGLTVPAAIRRAQDQVNAGAEVLAAALAAFDGGPARSVMTAALGLRPLEHAIEGVLLAALERLDGAHGPLSIQWAWGLRWANDWLLGARHLAVVLPGAPLVW